MGKRCYGCMKEKSSVPLCEHCGWDERRQNEPHQLPIGTILENKYVVGRVLGQGGFGITYMGWDTMLEIPIAIKEYFPTGLVARESSVSTQVSSYGTAGERFQESRERFLREAKALAKFSAIPQIVHIYNFFQANNTAYIIMEYAEGVTLRDYVRRNGALSQDQALSLLGPVMIGLEQLHREGIIHRDISPDNIMLLPRGGAKLLDFGAVRDVSGAVPGEDAPKSTMAILKQGYAPIEQYRGKGDMGPWTDVYALCATICFCLTGKTPPDATERMMASMAGEDDGLNFEKIASGNPQLQKALTHGMAHLAVNRTRSIAQLVEEMGGDSGEEERKAQEKARKERQEQEARERAERERLERAEQERREREARAKAERERREKESREVQPPEKKKSPWLAIAIAAILALVALTGLSNTGADKQAKTPQEESSQSQSKPVFATSENPVLASADWESYLEENGFLKREEVGQMQAFGTFLKRSEVEELTFLSSVAEMTDYAVDVSQNQDGSVWAWAKDKHLYIGTEGVVQAPEDCSYLFAGMENLKSIDFREGFSTDGTVSMVGVFMECDSLTEILGMDSWNTENVTSMRRMFYSCDKLSKLSVGGWNISCVTDLSEMFQFCMGLLEIAGVESWNTASVTDMCRMFYSCLALKELPIGSWDTSHVTKMTGMFDACGKLQELQLGNWDTACVARMDSMFSGCKNLKELPIGSWDTANVTHMNYMFKGCDKLESLPIHNWNTAKVGIMQHMFEDTPALTELPAGKWNVEKVKNSKNGYKDFADEGDTINGRPWEEYFR